MKFSNGVLAMKFVSNMDNLRWEMTWNETQELPIKIQVHPNLHAKTPKQSQLDQIKSYSHANCFKMFVRSNSTMLCLPLPIISKNRSGVLARSEDASQYGDPSSKLRG